MKRIFILAASFYMVACSQSEQTVITDAEATIAVDTVTLVDTAQVDGVSGATNVANVSSFNGVLMVPPQQHATVSLTMGGIVRSTSLMPGRYVQKGEVLATLDNPEFIILQQSYLDAVAQLEFLEKEYHRQQNLVSQEAASQKRFQQSKADYLSMKSKVEATSAQLSLLGIDIKSLRENTILRCLEVKSPLTGYITNANINVGKYLNPGEPICEIIDKSKLMLQLTAYEKDLSRLKEGSTVEFRVNGMGMQVFQAVLLSVDQTVDQENRSVKVYAILKNSDPLLRPGMYVNAKIKKN